MAKNSKKRYNWKARSGGGSTERTYENTDLADVVVQDKNDAGSGYNDSNAFALPSKSEAVLRKNRKNDLEPVGKILSKRRRKHLEKIVEKKAKKENRAELLQRLETNQVSEDYLEKMTSLSKIQTKGLKRQFAEDDWIKRMQEAGEDFEDAAAASDSDGENQSDKPSAPKKVKLKPVSKNPRNRMASDDPNVVGFESSSSSGSEEEESESEPEINCDGRSNEADLSDQTVTQNHDDTKDKCTRDSSANPIVNEKANSEVSENKSKVALANVPISRDPAIQSAREKLPILSEEQSIMETINENPITILVGETGSGKTTQVPQFLYEAGYATDRVTTSSESGGGGKALKRMIGVTEPRRVAAMAMADRVGKEMSLPADVVSYQIRFEGTVTEKTRIKFMTDGVLLREIERDFLLTKYSAIVIDEAHERSVFTDILVGFLSRIVPKREAEGDPLKLIIMSATLRVEDFTQNARLFKTPPPVVKVDSRQFDVQCHFNRKTNDDYMEEAFKKVCKIHRTLPEGGILVFLTGQAEVKLLVKKLQKMFPAKSKVNLDAQNDDAAEEEALKTALGKNRRPRKKGGRKSSESQNGLNIKSLPNINLDNYEVLPHADDTAADAARDADLDDDLAINGDDSEGDEEQTAINPCGPGGGQPMWTLPLYSLLSSERQNRIFGPVPDGHRLCVVATNVAETSLTIPGIKYVVDTGKIKNKLYDKVTGVSTFQVMWASKAQANQRAGRAGRQGPGHCYRLYSSAVFENSFDSFSLPEISSRPLDDLVLQMKSMYLDNVVNFPFPTPPEASHVRAAERKLIALGALEAPPKNLPSLKEVEAATRKAKITRLGRAIATFPLAPRFGKMLALSHQHGMMQYTITMVAALSLQEVLLETPVGNHTDQFNKAELSGLRRTWAGKGQSFLLGDPMVLIRAVGAAEYAGCTQEFCERNGLRYKAMLEIRKLRRQLTNEVNSVMAAGSTMAGSVVLDPSMPPPTDNQARLLRQIVLSGSPDQVAHKVDLDGIEDPKERTRLKYAYMTPDLEEPVFLKSTSVLKNTMPEWITYQEIYEIQGKMYLRCATAIEPSWLPTFCPTLCQLSPPLLGETPGAAEPWLDDSDGQVYCNVNGTFGKRSWLLPTIPVLYPNNHDKFKLFAKFLLEGKVLKWFATYTPQLLSPPLVMCKSWGTLHGKRTTVIFEELLARGVDNRDKLKHALKRDPLYLRSAFLKWIPESNQLSVRESWKNVLKNEE